MENENDEIKLLEEQAAIDLERMQADADIRADLDQEYSGIPAQAEKESFYQLLQKIIATDDSSKVGNLSKSEIGMLKHTVRHYQRVSLLCNALDRGKVGEYFKAKGEIILSTSLSKNAKLLTLSVSKIRTSENIRSNSGGDNSGNKSSWWKKFSKGDVPDE